MMRKAAVSPSAARCPAPSTARAVSTIVMLKSASGKPTLSQLPAIETERDVVALSHAAATVIVLLSFDPSTTNALRTGWRYFQ